MRVVLSTAAELKFCYCQQHITVYAAFSSYL